MRKIIAILLFFLAPLLVNGATGDITVNNQSTYAVPSGTTRVLILDLTLPEKLTSIKILNLGDAQQSDISGIYIFEDGSSSGWDGDEKEIARESIYPFWDTEIPAVSSQLRIFVLVDIASAVTSGKTIRPQATINSDKMITGVERTISTEASIPDVPQAPLARFGEAISTSTIRWNFLDSANNEFGFRIKDSSLKTKAEVLQTDLSYIDETGLQSNTCYSGRRVSAFNDRGEGSASLNFTEVCTLQESLPPVEVPVVQEPTSTPPIVTEEVTPPVEKPVAEMTADELQAKIAQILAQIAVLQEQLTVSKTGAKITGCTITSFDRNLKQGMSGNDVKCLQIILNSSADTKITAAGEGSAGQETTYFGSLTKAAVIKFQEKYASEILTPSGLSKGTGFVASATRARLNGLLGK